MFFVKLFLLRLQLKERDVQSQAVRHLSVTYHQTLSCTLPAHRSSEDKVLFTRPSPAHCPPTAAVKTRYFSPDPLLHIARPSQQ